MRWLSVALVALLVLLQYPLWVGKGGWLRVWDVDRQLQQQKEGNRKLEVRNAGLDAEVRDLKQGYDAIEERALRVGNDQTGRDLRPDPGKKCRRTSRRRNLPPARSDSRLATRLDLA